MFARENLSYEAIKLPPRADISDTQMQQAALDYYHTMKQRHSVRDFIDREVPSAVIEECIRTAGSAPSGANHQPWHFVAIRNPDIKHQIRLAAEAEEEKFYAGGGGDEWIKALEPIGTNAHKPHLDIAPWLIVIFAQRYGVFDDGTRFKNYYVPDSVGIATGFLISALHHAGLCSLTHTPNPMRFLNKLLDRPDHEKAVMIMAVGHPSPDATVPGVAKIKKSLDEILTVV
ncbi:MAG TPA: nitroreductase family protein [Oceanospirillaceae bacterium]|nr:nitroreductase family protein [Oceanospirillaceae bacterium]